jgi:amino acid permease
MSLGMPWGLFKHYWVLFILVLTVFSTVILLGFTRTLSSIVDAAANPAASTADLHAMGAGLNHAVGALVVLLIILGLSVYKTQGLTRYSWCKPQEKRNKPRKLTNN